MRKNLSQRGGGDKEEVIEEIVYIDNEGKENESNDEIIQ